MLRGDFNAGLVLVLSESTNFLTWLVRLSYPFRFLFKKKPKWTPPSYKDQALETYIKAVRNDIHQSLDHGPKTHQYDNLTSQERKALCSLRTRTDIVIKPGNKDLATEIMSTNDYLVKVMNNLENKPTKSWMKT